jgi:hypothetical protein
MSGVFQKKRLITIVSLLRAMWMKNASLSKENSMKRGGPSLKKALLLTWTINSLNDVGRRRIEELLGMDRGHVIDYTDTTFTQFFKRHKINIDDARYKTYGISRQKDYELSEKMKVIFM